MNLCIYFAQKLNTTNECVVSVLGGISSTAHQVLPPLTTCMLITLIVINHTIVVVWIS